MSLAGGPPFPLFLQTNDTVGAPSFAAVAKGGIDTVRCTISDYERLGYRVENRTTIPQALRTSLIQLFRQIE
jgi:hypothetical protein